ncbi:TPA: hypothetical protein N0F65_003807, partial [Lagenidium giganteum]
QAKDWQLLIVYAYGVDKLRFPAQAQAYHGLPRKDPQLSKSAMTSATSPLSSFWYFLPKTLWRKIAVVSNWYAAQTRKQRARATVLHQRERKKSNAHVIVESVKSVRERLKAETPITPREIVVFIGLLIARMLCPQKRLLSHHWRTTQVGAIPAATFGEYMSRNRINYNTSVLHVANNDDPRTANGRAWIIRPLLDCLQKTFRRGMPVPPKLSFDEGITPSRSRFNRMRVYIKEKPHKWGTKVVLACCAKTAYFLRRESWTECCPSKPGSVVAVNHVRLTPGGDRSLHHIREVGRGTVQAQHLLLGQTNRLGFPKAIIDKSARRPKIVERGSFKIAVQRGNPLMTAVSWMDNKPVHLLATGASKRLVEVDRSQSDGRKVKVPAPQLVKDYHDLMGGVDIHDRLRRQRYSVQQACRFKKYYKPRFLGLVDMALVNAYIIHREHKRHQGSLKGSSHRDFFETLQQELLSTDDADFEAMVPITWTIPPPPRADHCSITTQWK